MKLSVTERGTWRRCRRQWSYSIQLRLQPTMSKPALELGSLVHGSLAAWLQQPDADLDAIYIDTAKQRLDELVSNTSTDTEALETMLATIEKGRALIKGYQATYKKPLPDDFTLLQPEQEVHIPFYNAGDDADSNYLKMKLDALVQDKLGTLYVLEHKTYSRQPTPESLTMNDQFLAYIWGATKLQLGKVGGLLYDGIGKTKVPTYYRTILQRSQEELDEFGLYLEAEAHDIQYALSTPGDAAYLYPNHRWEGCWDCAYTKLCVAQSRGEDTDYVKSTYFKVRPPSEADLLAEPE